jgi:hypothetical protein
MDDGKRHWRSHGSFVNVDRESLATVAPGDDWCTQRDIATADGRKFCACSYLADCNDWCG